MESQMTDQTLVWLWLDVAWRVRLVHLIGSSSQSATRCWTPVLTGRDASRIYSSVDRLLTMDQTLVRVWSLITVLASCSRWSLIGRIRSLWPERSVTRNVLSWTPTSMLWSGEYKYLSYSSNLALLPICLAEKHLWSTRESKSLVGWLRFENPRLRTILVHRK